MWSAVLLEAAIRTEGDTEVVRGLLCLVRCFETKIAAIWRGLGHFTRPNVAPIKIAP